MSGRSILVTGASTGIGRAIALHLAEHRFRVFASVRRDADEEELVRRSASRVTVLRVDVTSGESIRAAAELLTERLGDGGLDGLVNNAGIAVSGPFEFLDLADLRHQFEVNVFGQVAVTQSFLPLLRRTRGRIVNMSSISGRLASPFLGPYAMSKFALEAFTDSLRRELAPFGLHVSAIEPGAIQTPIWDKGIEASRERVARMPPEALELYGERMELLRQRAREMNDTGAPAEEVAKAVHHALTADPPKTRYLVGRDARLSAKLAWLLPDGVIDKLVARRFRP